MALETKHDAEYLWGGFDGVQQTKETLTKKASEYEGLALLHAKTLSAGREFAAGYRKSAGQIAGLHDAIAAAKGDEMIRAQRNLLEAHSPLKPKQQAAAACAGIRAASPHPRRVSCALLARASYTSLRFSVVGTDQLAGPAIKDVVEHASRLGGEADSFAKAQRARHDSLLAIAANWKSASGPKKDALEAKRIALIASSVEATSRELRQFCPGVP